MHSLKRLLVTHVQRSAFLILILLSSTVCVAAVNVRDFGAVGDGKADDTVAIQKAIAEVSKRGGVVNIPSGSYRISETISVPSRVRLIGAHFATTLFVAPEGLKFDLIEIKDAHAVTVEQITLVEENHSFKGKGNGVHISGKSENILIEKVASFGFQNGFAIGRTEDSEVSGVTFRDCHAEGATGMGFQLNLCRQVTLDNCKAFRNRLDGIKFRKKVTDVVIRGGESSHNGVTGPNGNGVDGYAGGSSFIIRDLLVEHNNGSGIYIKTGPLLYQDFGEVGRGIISDVIARHNKGSGVDLNRSGGDLVKEGQEKLPPMASHFVVTGGLYEQNTRSGIYVRARNVSILAPLIRLNGYAGIELGSGWDVQISGAQITGNSTAEPRKFSGIEVGYDEVIGTAQRVQIRDSVIDGIDDIWQVDGSPVEGRKPTHRYAIRVRPGCDNILVDGNILRNWSEKGDPVLVETSKEATVIVRNEIQPVNSLQ